MDRGSSLPFSESISGENSITLESLDEGVREMEDILYADSAAAEAVGMMEGSVGIADARDDAVVLL